MTSRDCRCASLVVYMQEKRDLIIHEFYTTEQHYVEALQLLVEVSHLPFISSYSAFFMESDQF